jgi:hypothetical protein
LRYHRRGDLALQKYPDLLEKHTTHAISRLEGYPPSR